MAWSATLCRRESGRLLYDARMRLSLVLLTLLASVLHAQENGELTIRPTTEARAANLKPRALPAKEPLQIPPGNSLRLLVKFKDEFRARAGAAGELTVEATDESRVQSLARLVRDEPIRFRSTVTVSEEKIEALRERAAKNSGVAQPDLAGVLEIVPANSLTPVAMIALAEKFRRLAEVEFVQLESIDRPPPPPASDIFPPTPLLSGSQTYRTAAGINADAVWAKYGVRGDGIRLRDCEYQFNISHEDLADTITLQAGISSMYSGFGDDHGTATLGEIGAAENAYGMTGICPGARIFFYPEFSTRTDGSTQVRSAAVTAAVADSAPGDVVMLEMQTVGPNGGTKYVPAEYDLAVWNAVKTGTDAGVLVVAAAGNGGEDLDSAAFATYRARGNSGAFIVGAGDSSRSRYSFSTYGSRVDLQGLGGGVASLGYSWQVYGGDHNQAYTNSFSGTSSATPIVTGATVLVQSLAAETIGRRLTPVEMRQLLVATGRPQSGSVAQKIGPLPDLSAALGELYVRYPLSFTRLSGWGRYYFGNPSPNLAADDDGDLWNNLFEYFLGTDPTANISADYARRPQLQMQNGHAIFSFISSAALTDVAWSVEASESLAPNSWHNLSNGVDGVVIARNGDAIRVDDPYAGGARFYRLRVALTSQ